MKNVIKFLILAACALGLTGATFVIQPYRFAAASTPPTFVRKVDGVAAQDTGFYEQTISSVQCDGANRLLVVVVSSYYSSSGGVSAVTFNGSESLTKLTEQGTGASRISIWYKVAPTATTANVLVEWGTWTEERASVALVFTGVNQSTPFGTYAQSDTYYPNDGPAFISNSVTTSTSDLVLDGLNYWQNNTYTPDTGQTERAVSHQGGYSSVRVSTKAASAGSTSLRWDFPAGTYTRQIVVPIKAP